jgi:hypothetical protein
VQPPALQRRPECPLNRGHHGGIVVRDEGEGHPGSGGTTGAANAMHIGVDARRHIVVNDVRNVPHIETACRKVGRHQDLERATPEAVQGRLALGLRQVALQRCGAVARLCQMVCDTLRLMLRACKHQA